MTFVWEETTAEDRQFIESLHIKNPWGPGEVEPPVHWAVSRSTQQAVLMLGGGLHGEVPNYWLLIDGHDCALAEGTKQAQAPLAPNTRQITIDRVYVSQSLSARRSETEILAAFRKGLTQRYIDPQPGATVEFPGNPSVEVSGR